MLKSIKSHPLGVFGVCVLTFLLALRRSALRLAFSSSLKSSSPFIAPWAHKRITDPSHVVPSPRGGPTLPCHPDTICLPGTKWHYRSGQRWQRRSPSAPPAAGQGGLLRGKHDISAWEHLAVGGNVRDQNMMSVAAVLFSPSKFFLKKGGGARSLKQW